MNIFVTSGLLVYGLLAAFTTQVASNCDNANLANNACATLFPEPNCQGTPYVVQYGAGNLRRGNRDVHESILVRKGCSFRGYDVAANWTTSTGAKKSNFQLVNELGKKEIVNAEANRNKAHNFKRLEEEVEFVSCTLGNQGKCPAVPEHLCAICYDEVSCDAGDWSPFDIPITRANKPFSLSNPERNGIESCSVRKGCSLILMDTDTFGDKGNLTLAATRGKDRHINLKKNPDKAIAAMTDDAEEVACFCGIQEKPLFGLGIRN